MSTYSVHYIHSPKGKPLVPTWDGNFPKGDYFVQNWDDYPSFCDLPCLLVAGEVMIRVLSEQRFAQEIGGYFLLVIFFVKVFTFSFAPNAGGVHICNEIMVSILLA